MIIRWLVRLAVVCALMAATPIARATPAGQGLFAKGAVIALQGTQQLWFADDAGMLHWGGDTRALLGHDINWGNRLDVTVDQLISFRRSDPWLSLSLLKMGDPIYLPKWETTATVPTLYHIQVIGDVELFGINAGNYGAMVLDQAEWERRFGFSAAGLARAELEPVSAPPAADLAPSTSALVVPNQAVINGRGDYESTSWVVGEVRNDGAATACGIAVTATFSDNAGNTGATRTMRTDRHPMEPGAVWPYQMTLSNLGEYPHLDVRAVARAGAPCTAVPLPVRDLGVYEDRDDNAEISVFHATGTVRNTSGRAVNGVRVVVWFVDRNGSVMDVISPEGGEPASADRLDRGQSASFDIQSKSSAINGWVGNIASARAVAFGD